MPQSVEFQLQTFIIQPFGMSKLCVFFTHAVSQGGGDNVVKIDNLFNEHKLRCSVQEFSEFSFESLFK